MAELLEYLPPKLRPLIAGALMFVAVAGATYGMSSYAATQAVSPVAAKVLSHEEKDDKYLYPLLEAIWSDLRSLCKANPTAQCDGYNPLRTVRHE